MRYVGQNFFKQKSDRHVCINNMYVVSPMHVVVSAVTHSIAHQLSQKWLSEV